MSGTGSDNGWLEAAIAWEVCASLHRQYCKGKDALFTTRQSDFVKHAENARVRASHGQAPAGATEPTEQQILEAAEKAGLWPNTVRSWIPAFHRYHKELAKAQPAPAQADSVQEDAADPLQGAANWLAEAHGQFSPVILSGCLMIGYNRAKRLHDAALAAKAKQGERP